MATLVPPIFVISLLEIVALFLKIVLHDQNVKPLHVTLMEIVYTHLLFVTMDGHVLPMHAIHKPDV